MKNRKGEDVQFTQGEWCPIYGEEEGAFFIGLPDYMANPGFYRTTHKIEYLDGVYADRGDAEGGAYTKEFVEARANLLLMAAAPKMYKVLVGLSSDEFRSSWMDAGELALINAALDAADDVNGLILDED